MRLLYACLTQQHNFTLVAVAALICCLGSGAAFALGREALRQHERWTRVCWAVAGVVAAAGSIWATHFIAMLAFEPGLPFRLELGGTVLSFVAALLLVATGATMIAALPGWLGRAGGGAIVGVAISAMHYTGMAAYQVQGSLHWHYGMVAASVVCGTVVATVAVLLPFKAPRLGLLGPLLLVLAICADHFIGMAALTVEFDPLKPVPAGMVDERILALLASGASLLIIGLSLSAVWLARQARRRSMAEEQQLRDVADMSVDGLLICRGEALVRVNRSLELMLERGTADLIGRSVADIGLDLNTLQAGRESDARLTGASGAAIPVRVIARETLISGKHHLVVAVRDQRGTLRNEEKMRLLAHSDALTGLSNRLDFTQRLTTRTLPGGDAFALLFLDLDRFKAVNDTFGHAMGDALLRRVAGRLKRAVRANDVVARLGGDEFAIIANVGTNSAAARRIASDLVDLLCRPFLIDGQILEIGTSVGIAMAPADANEPDALSRCADLALYRAKEEGGRGFRFFDQELSARMQARRTLELELRRAAAANEFEVYYQPQVNPRTGKLEGAEALVRWHHPKRGLVSPAEFIPLAEEIGLISSISELVLRTACAEAARWPSHLSVAVNLSPVQFRDPQLAEGIAAILAETGLPGSRLELEVTENALLQDEGNTLTTLNALRAQGIRLSMDDFGTGYSSLSYLRRFPFDKIKIDQSFIRQVPGDGDSIAIVQAIAGLGAKLGMTITVEGVETAEQRAFTVAEGCDQIQGYLISRPVPATSMRDIIETDAVQRAAA